MFFEGAEKKLEMVISSSVGDLRGKDWPVMVTKVGAQILSKMTSPDCDAYLLSESSLFVWKNRLTMITCGQTTLVDVAIDLFEEYGENQVELFIFERKNESFPYYQKSDIFKDLKRLYKHMPGKAYRFGDTNEHHLFLFHLDKAFEPQSSDQTLEVLMYEIQGEARRVFTEVPHCGEGVHKLLGVEGGFFTRGAFEGFQLDSHLFKPMGYSCNALKGEEYFAIHVTPQLFSPYVSFETNMVPRREDAIGYVINLFQPKSFDVVDFRPSLAPLCEMLGYQIINNVCQRVSCGYEVCFASYYQPPPSPKAALLIEASDM